MPNFFSLLYERFGLNAYVQGDYAKAERWFRKLEAKEPDTLKVLRNLGVILLARGDAEGAERYLLREEKLYGPSFHRHAALADIAYARGKRKEAARRYALALAEPELAPGGKAASSRHLMETRAAVCSSEKAFEDSRESMKRFDEAGAARERGLFEEAVRLFDESARLDSTNWPALNNAGSVLLNQLGRAEEARARFKAALELSPNPQVLQNLALSESALETSSKTGGRRGGRS